VEALTARLRALPESEAGAAEGGATHGGAAPSNAKQAGANEIGGAPEAERSGAAATEASAAVDALRLLRVSRHPTRRLQVKNRQTKAPQTKTLRMKIR